MIFAPRVLGVINKMDAKGLVGLLQGIISGKDTIIPIEDLRGAGLDVAILSDINSENEKSRKLDVIVIPEGTSSSQAYSAKQRYYWSVFAKGFYHKDDFDITTEKGELPRVLVQVTRQSGYFERSEYILTGENPFMDSTTTKLIFNPEHKRNSGKRLDDRLYTLLRFRKDAFRNPVNITIRKHLVPEREDKYGNFLPREVLFIPLNYYGLGGEWHGYSPKTNNFFVDLRRSKYNNIEEIYENQWIVPPGSLELSRERLKLTSELIEDEEHFEKVRELENKLNHLLEPYTHLSAMSKLATSRILKSKWSANLDDPKAYVDDYQRIAKDFIALLSDARTCADEIFSESFEMQRYISIVRTILTDENSSLVQAEEFLKSIVNSSVRTYKHIAAITETMLKSRSAKLDPELEEFERGDYYWRRDDWKQKAMLYRFHKQHVVTGAETALQELDYIGSVLSAHTARAEYQKKYEWVKPVIADPEIGIVEIVEGYFPFTKPQHGTKIIPNNSQMDKDRSVQSICGPNVSGKTINLDTEGFIQALAMAGSYVPAKEATISWINYLYMRLKRTSMGDSALVQELPDLQGAIELLDSGCHVYIGLDETGTSTNNVEGEALTYGLMRRAHDDPCARMSITIHYPSLYDLEDDPTLPGLFFTHFEFMEQVGEEGKKRIVFPHEKLPGKNPIGDYAIVLAENEGVHPEIVKAAYRYREERR